MCHLMDSGEKSATEIEEDKKMIALVDVRKAAPCVSL